MQDQNEFERISKTMIETESEREKRKMQLLTMNEHKINSIFFFNAEYPMHTATAATLYVFVCARVRA